MNNRERYMGHNSLGYAGNGIYKCECGTEFKAPNGKALNYNMAVSAALIDQWKAHCKEVTK
jgi:hypothetical protein